jgi:pilus assembly protein FimV
VQAGGATPSIDFNFDLDAPAARTPPPADNVLDFDINTADLTAPATEKADAGGNGSGADDDLASLQFDMPADNVIEFEGGKGGTAATVEPTEADTAPAGGDDDIKWEVDASLAAPDAPAADAGEGSGNGADAHWDETATKLDLAKAYIDMGDNEGARSILDEVLAEGNEQQKKQAADLASQIA